MSKIELYNGDCLEVMKQIPDNSVNLIVTSPPYNVDLGNNKYNKNPYSLYKDNKEHKEYINWLKEIFFNLYPKLKKGGVLMLVMVRTVLWRHQVILFNL